MKQYYINSKLPEIEKERYYWVWTVESKEKEDRNFKIKLKNGYEILDEDDNGNEILVHAKYIEYENEEGQEEMVKENNRVVIITKEWAKAIEEYKVDGISFDNAFTDFLDKDIISGENTMNYDSITSEEFAIAYLVGYEVELTPEQKLLNEYNKLAELDGDEYQYYINGMIDTLDILNITIEGINGK